MKTKNIFSFKSLIACAFIVSSLGINKAGVAQNTKQVHNLPTADQYTSSIDLYSKCKAYGEYILKSSYGRLEFVGEVFSIFDSGSIDLDNLYLPYKIKGVCKKAPTSNYRGDSIFYVMLDNGNIEEYTITGCPPKIKFLQGFQNSVPATYPSGPTLNDILGDKIYVKESGWIMSTADTGKTWQIDTAGLNLGMYGFVISLSIDTNQTVWEFSVPGAGKAGLYKQLTNSNTWTKVPSFTNLDANTVRVDANNTIWIVTGNDSIIYSTNGGNSWKGHNFAQGYQVTQTCVDAFGYLYALGATLLYRSVDSGATWTRIGPSISNMVYDTTSGNTIFNDISGDSVLNLATNYGAYYSFDHGNTWLMDSIPAENIYGYQQYSNGRKVISTPLARFLLKAGDTTWTQTYPVGVYYPTNNEIGDNNWNAPIQKIYQDDLGHLFMQGFKTIGNGYDVVRSNDSGATWIEDTLGMHAVGAASSTYGYYYVDSMGTQHISVNSTPARVFSKTLSGAWIIDTAGIGAAEFIYVFAFVDANGWVYAGGESPYNSGYNGRVMRRPITGGSWTLDTSGMGSQWIFNLAKDGKGDIMAYEPSGVSNSLNAKVFYRSAAMGKWNSTPSLPSPLSFSNGNAMYLTGNNESGWLLSTNFYYGGFSFPYYQNNGVWCSTDSGTTWNMIALDSLYINQLETIEDTVFALTDNGLYKNFTCATNITTNIQHSTSNMQHAASVYPNPNNGNFMLEYNLPNNDGELRIIDVMGKLVYNSKITNQQGTQTINATGLSEGVYFWQVYSGDKLIDKGKMAVVK